MNTCADCYWYSDITVYVCELADFVWSVETAGREYGPRGKKSWIDWLREES